MNKKIVSTVSEIEELTSQYPEWRYSNNSLSARYACNSFEEAISLLNQAASIFSELDHHPTIENTYNKISFTLMTHDAGDKVTGIDIAVAKRISKILNSVN